MSIENPLNETKETPKEVHREIEGLSEAELESLEGDEKLFAEFKEKRLQMSEAQRDLWDTVYKIGAPDILEKIREGENFTYRMAYQRFASIGEDRLAKIESGVIARWKARMTPAEKEEEELRTKLGRLHYLNTQARNKEKS